MNIDYTNLKEKIYNEIRRLNIKANEIWTGNNFINGFKCHLNNTELNILERTVQSLFDEGIFEDSPNGCRLTTKGEDIIYHNVLK